MGLSPAHGLLGIAGEDGRLECFDPRQRVAVGSIDAAAAAGVVSAGVLLFIRKPVFGTMCMLNALLFQDAQPTELFWRAICTAGQLSRQMSSP